MCFNDNGRTETNTDRVVIIYKLNFINDYSGTGKARGWAYVEFEEESSAAKALLGLDQLQIGENKISVSISNPPPSKKREDWLTRKEGGVRKKNEKPTLEPEKTVRKGPFERKTQVMLLPRSVRVQDEFEMDQGEGKQGLSNEDFKKMLSK